MTTAIEAPTDLCSVKVMAGKHYPDVGERFIRRCADERRIPIYRVGGRLLISRSEFAAYLAAGRIEPTAS